MSKIVATYLVKVTLRKNDTDSDIEPPLNDDVEKIIGDALWSMSDWLMRENIHVESDRTDK